MQMAIRFLALLVITMSLVAASKARDRTSPATPSEPGKIWLTADRLYMIEPTKGIRIFSIGAPATPVELGMITATETSELAVFETAGQAIVYADNNGNLDIWNATDPAKCTLVKTVSNVCEKTSYGYMSSWEGADDTSCAGCSDGTDDFCSSSGSGGSLARFALVGDYLYGLRYGQLQVIQINGGIASPTNPLSLGSYIAGWDVETISPALGHLFLGASSGVHVFSLDNPAAPVRIGSLTHARARDPVVVESPYAYVTLRDGTFSDGGPVSRLEVLDLNNLTNMTRKKTIGLSNPYGLAVKNGDVFVCNGYDGLMVFGQIATAAGNDATGRVSGYTSRDAIAAGDLLYVTGLDGIRIYSIASPNPPALLAKINRL